MANKYCFILLAVILLSVSCRNLKVSNEHLNKKKPELELQGRDINKVRDEFLAEGFYVSKIVDQTGKGDHLSMTVDLNGSNGSFIDVFGYVTGVDLAPWKKGEITHLRIRSDMNGKIYMVQPR